MIPSISGILEHVVHGSAYAILPEEMVQSSIHSGALTDLFPNYRMQIPLYWHVVQTEIPLLKILTKKLLAIKGDV